MAFNVGSISTYVDQLKQELITASVLQGETLNLISVIPGIKYSEALNQLSNTISVQNATCGFTSNGSLALSQRNITVTALEVKEELCPKTLEKYWMGQKMKPGTPKDATFEEIFSKSYVEKINEFNEMTLWQGNTSSTGNTYCKFDGFYALLTGETSKIQLTGTSSGVTSSVAFIDAVVAKIPAAILSRNDLYIFMSYANYVVYVQNLRALNLYQFTSGDMGTNYSTKVPGTTITVKATHGLDGTNYLVATYAENLIAGCDLENEDEKFSMLYDPYQDNVKVNIQWKLGAQIAFPQHVVTNF